MLSYIGFKILFIVTSHVEGIPTNVVTSPSLATTTSIPTKEAERLTPTTVLTRPKFRCENRWSRRYCNYQSSTGGCMKPSVRHRCNMSCNVCCGDVWGKYYCSKRKWKCTRKKSMRRNCRKTCKKCE